MEVMPTPEHEEVIARKLADRGSELGVDGTKYYEAVDAELLRLSNEQSMN